jgi:hypothetical protein
MVVVGMKPFRSKEISTAAFLFAGYIYQTKKCSSVYLYNPSNTTKEMHDPV